MMVCHANGGHVVGKPMEMKILNRFVKIDRKLFLKYNFFNYKKKLSQIEKS